MDPDSHAAEAVLARYDLEQPEVAGRVTHGFANESLEVRNTTGARYLLRRHRGSIESERLAFQLDFQRHLARAGVPVAPVVQTASGDDFILHQERLWVLFGWMDGTEYDFSDVRQTKAAGRALAAFRRRALQAG